MSQDCPAGYITLTAAEIIHGCCLYLADREAVQKAWDEDLVVKVVAYAKSLTWFGRWWHNGAPTDPSKAKRWYYTSHDWSYPNVPGVDTRRPVISDDMIDWARRAAHLAPDTKVFINIADAATIKAWINSSKKETP
jgi:hypothetical protein